LIAGKMRISPGSTAIERRPGAMPGNPKTKEGNAEEPKKDAERAARELKSKRAAKLFHGEENANGSYSSTAGGSGGSPGTGTQTDRRIQARQGTPRIQREAG